MIKQIRLQQYRSYLDKTVDFSPEVNVIIGPNASGKTNLLEAVLVACVGKSYRAQDNDLIMHDKQWARIDCETTEAKRTVKINSTPSPSKEIVIGNKTHKRIGFKDQFPIVLFEPNDLLMLNGAPEARRKYLDTILEQTTPNYRSICNNYLKVLRQRNALLKKPGTTVNEIFPWNINLSQRAGLIVESRENLCHKLNTEVSNIYKEITKNNARINLRYKPFFSKANYESELFKKLESSLELDRLKGYTTYGPHREDMEVLINNKLPKNVSSRGENRSIVLAMKITEQKLIEHSRLKRPPILLDDVFSELDLVHQTAILDYFKKQQTIITTVSEIPPLKSTNLVYTTPPNKSIL